MEQQSEDFWTGYRTGRHETYINRAIADVADNAEKYGVLDGFGGKAIRYWGWYWRDVEWSRDYVTLASDDGTGARAGFCENNKWGYEQRTIKGAHWDSLKAIAQKIYGLRDEGETRGLIREMNATLSEAWDAALSAAEGRAL